MYCVILLCSCDEEAGAFKVKPYMYEYVCIYLEVCLDSASRSRLEAKSTKVTKLDQEK